MDEYAYGLIRQRKENKEYTTKEDVLSRFLKVEDENGNPQYTDKELRDVIMNFLIAGRYANQRLFMNVSICIFFHLLFVQGYNCSSPELDCFPCMPTS